MLVSGGYDSQALVWDLTGRMPDGQWRTGKQRPEKLRTAWDVLAGDDARAAYAALWQLTADPEGAVALLRQRLRPIARPEAGRVARLIAALDSEKFAERERAGYELAMLEEAAAADLRETLARKPSLEVRKRVETLLKRLEHLPTGAQLQALRAIEALEHMGTPEARTLLRKLADGSPGARLTQEARTALGRLERGATGNPNNYRRRSERPHPITESKSRSVSSRRGSPMRCRSRPAASRASRATGTRCLAASALPSRWRASASSQTQQQSVAAACHNASLATCSVAGASTRAGLNLACPNDHGARISSLGLTAAARTPTWLNLVQ
jgi:hypothetical protein